MLRSHIFGFLIIMWEQQNSSHVVITDDVMKK